MKKAAPRKPKAPKKTAGPVEVSVRLWEPIMPVDRGARYEEPLDAALRKKRLGEVTGGGSMLTEAREIEFVDLEVSVTDLDKAVPVIQRVLEEAGAPRGSLLSFERDGEDEVVPFGKQECLAIYLDGVGLPTEVYQSTDVRDLAARMRKALGKRGEIRHSWTGPKETAIYLFGPDAQALYDKLQPVLHAYPLCQNARVVIRHGSYAGRPKTLRVKADAPKRA